MDVSIAEGRGGLLPAARIHDLCRTYASLCIAKPKVIREGRSGRCWIAVTMDGHAACRN